MPKPDFFRPLGLFVVPEFLDCTSGTTLIDQILSFPAEKGMVVKPSGEETVAEDVRKVKSSIIPKEIRLPLQQRLMGLIPDLEKHFSVTLDGCEPPQFLIYNPGDFFKPHKDGAHGGKHASIRRRRVSVVIFLNQESHEPSQGTYGQGHLTFYGLLDGPQWERCAFPLSAEPGLLVAFSADKLHEVTPVTHGRRFTVVTWFYAPDPDSWPAVREPAD